MAGEIEVINKLIRKDQQEGEEVLSLLDVPQVEGLQAWLERIETSFPSLSQQVGVSPYFDSDIGDYFAYAPPLTENRFSQSFVMDYAVDDIAKPDELLLLFPSIDFLAACAGKLIYVRCATAYGSIGLGINAGDEQMQFIVEGQNALRLYLRNGDTVILRVREDVASLDPGGDPVVEIVWDARRTARVRVVIAPSMNGGDGGFMDLALFGSNTTWNPAYTGTIAAYTGATKAYFSLYSIRDYIADGTVIELAQEGAGQIEVIAFTPGNDGGLGVQIHKPAGAGLKSAGQYTGPLVIRKISYTEYVVTGGIL